MASETRRLRRMDFADAVWPPDDTEESVVGTDLHQMTIINMRWGINEVARSLARTTGRIPWQALSQTIVLGFQRRDGSRFKTLPDVFIYHQPIDQNRRSVAVATDGPPVLIVEVLSESTHDVDLDLEEGKGYSYAHAGVREYLILDPTGDYIKDRGQGWRLHDGIYQPWQRDAIGRWQSEEIAVGFGIEDGLAAVYARDGERQLREGEVAQERERVRALEREVADLRQRVDELGQH